MATEQPDPILDRLAEDVLAQGMALASQAELLTPLLAVYTEDHRTLRFLIKTPNVRPHEAMRVILATTRATHAAICFEGWAVEITPPDDPAEVERWKRAAMRGTLPAGLPPASQHPDRYDQLTLLGQIRDRPAGYRVHDSWRITNGTPRTFARQEREPYVDAPSNFWPLFVGYDEIRGLVRLHAALARLRDEIRRG